MLLIELDDFERQKLTLYSKYNVPFSKSNKAYNDLVSEWERFVSGYNPKKAAQWWWYNVFTAIRNGYTALRVPMNQKKWDGNPCKISYRAVKSIVTHAEKEGFVERYTGNYFGSSKHETVLVFTDKLVKIVTPRITKTNFPRSRLEEVVECKLRGTEDQYVEIENSKEINEMRNQVEKYNDSLSVAEVKFAGNPVPFVEYKRVFSNDLFHGGRLYCHGGGVQTIPSKYRGKYLTIGDEPVIELDYSAMHPNLLYELEYRNDPENLQDFFGYDPYNANPVVDVDERTVKEYCKEFGVTQYNPLRNLYKHALMVMLNSKNEVEARMAINDKIGKDRKKSKQDRMFYGLKTVRTGLVMQALEDHNTMINHHFYRDLGTVLQKTDSDIALEVIDTLIQEGTTALAYHDSFMVRLSDKDILYPAMSNAWRKVLGSDKFCKISSK